MQDLSRVTESKNMLMYLFSVMRVSASCRPASGDLGTEAWSRPVVEPHADMCCVQAGPGSGRGGARVSAGLLRGFLLRRRKGCHAEARIRTESCGAQRPLCRKSVSMSCCSCVLFCQSALLQGAVSSCQVRGAAEALQPCAQERRVHAIIVFSKGFANYCDMMRADR